MSKSIFKGSVSEHSFCFLWSWSWFWFLSSLAHSFIPPLSQLFFWWWIVKQQECFLSPCGLTHNICFPFDRFWNRNSWERKWWLHDGSKISSLQKSSTYPSNLSPSRSALLPSTPPHHLLLFPSVGLSPNKVTSSCIVGDIVKFSLSPCGSDLAVISSNCDCNTETGLEQIGLIFFLQGHHGLISIFSVLPDWVIISHLPLRAERCQQL